MQLQEEMNNTEEKIIFDKITHSATKEEPTKLIDEVNACSEMLECMHRTKRVASEVKDDDFAEPLSKKPKILPETQHHRVMKSKLESFRIKTIRECLHGIPPPPSLTNPRISIEEVVEKLEDYYGK